MNSSKSKLIINDLRKSYVNSNLEVLKNISLRVNAGEIVSIIGPSGCGKSTLLDCIAGITTYDSGELKVDGGVSYMFQEDLLFPWRTVLSNITLPLELAGVKKENARMQAENLLKKFGLEKFRHFSPHMLSGGMRERISLLRMYINKKEILLLDEPFSKLDALTRLQMQEWFLHSLTSSKHAVLFVTHDVDEAILLSQRIYVFSKRPGQIIAEIPVPKKNRERVKNSILTLLRKNY